MEVVDVNGFKVKIEVWKWCCNGIELFVLGPQKCPKCDSDRFVRFKVSEDDRWDAVYWDKCFDCGYERVIDEVDELHECNGLKMFWHGRVSEAYDQ